MVIDGITLGLVIIAACFIIDRALQPDAHYFGENDPT